MSKSNVSWCGQWGKVGAFRVVTFSLAAIAMPILCVVTSALAAAPPNNGVSYQGKITRSDGTALESSSVVFNMRVLSSSGCVLYDERQTLDMTSSSGVFDLVLGQGTTTFTGNLNPSPVLTLRSVLSNSGSFTGLSGCASGTSYSPASGDTRELQVQFSENGGAWVAVTPNHVIRSTPYSQYAYSASDLDGVDKDGFIKVNSSSASLTQTNLEQVFQTPTNVTELLALIGGTSSQYVRAGATTAFSGAVSFSQAPTYSGSITSGTQLVTKTYSDSMLGGKQVDSSLSSLGAGQSGRVLSWDGTQWVATTPSTGITALTGDVTASGSGSIATTVAKIQGYSVSSTTPVSGQLLKYSGSSWAPANFGISDLKTSSGASQFSAANCSASQTITWSSITDTFSCSTITGLAATAITSGTLDAARLPALTGDVTTTVGAVATTIAGGAVTTAKIADDAVATAKIVDAAVTAAKLGSDVGVWALSGGNVSRASGNVGIGTTSPTGTLAVQSPAAESPGGTVSIAAYSNALTFSSSVTLNAGDVVATSAGIRIMIQTSGTGTSFSTGFYTGSSGLAATSFTIERASRLGLDSSGNARIVESNTMGTLVLGPAGPLSSNISGFHVVASGTTAPDSNRAIRFTRYSTNAAGPSISLTKARGTATAPEVVASGDTLGNINFLGFAQNTSTTQYAASSGASITSVAEAAPTSSGAVPAYLTFSTMNNAGTFGERLRISADGTGYFTGSVGIGISPPTAKLDVRGSSSAPANSGTTNNGILRVVNSSTNVSLDVGALGAAPWSAWIQAAEHQNLSSFQPLALNPNGGNVGIKTTDPQTTLQVEGVISPATDNTYTLGNGSYRFTSIYATNATVNTSDAREKKGVQDSDLGLRFVNKLRPVSFYWKSGADREVHYGLIAQETEAVITDVRGSRSVASAPIVDHDAETDRYGIRYTELIAPLIKAVQEFYGEFASLVTRVSSLEEKVSRLEEENAQLKVLSEKTEKENAEIKARLERIEKSLSSK